VQGSTVLRLLSTAPHSVPDRVYCKRVLQVLNEVNIITVVLVENRLI
jgi:hypothetical protein